MRALRSPRNGAGRGRIALSGQRLRLGPDDLLNPLAPVDTVPTEVRQIAQHLAMPRNPNPKVKGVCVCV